MLVSCERRHQFRAKGHSAGLRPTVREYRHIDIWKTFWRVLALFPSIGRIACGLLFGPKWSNDELCRNP